MHSVCQFASETRYLQPLHLKLQVFYAVYTNMLEISINIVSSMAYGSPYCVNSLHFKPATGTGVHVFIGSISQH